MTECDEIAFEIFDSMTEEEILIAKGDYEKTRQTVSVMMEGQGTTVIDNVATCVFYLIENFTKKNRG